MSNPAIPQPHPEKYVDRERGPYEITVITQSTPLATVSVTLPAETSKAKALAAATDYLGKCKPGAQVRVHRWPKGAHPTADPTPDQLVYHATIDEHRQIHAATKIA